LTASYGVQISDEELVLQQVLMAQNNVNTKENQKENEYMTTDEELVSQHVLTDYFTSAHTPATGLVGGEKREREDIIPLHVIDFNLFLIYTNI
jgi:hypothetical protein